MLLNFRPRFAELIQNGRKRQTIRAIRKDGKVPKVGETLYLWTGCRTKQARKLAEHKCLAVDKVEIHADKFVFSGHATSNATLLDDAAKLDGFKDWAELRDWFEEVHGLPIPRQPHPLVSLCLCTRPLVIKVGTAIKFWHESSPELYG
ncbi:MAG TPA: hypothetical protein VEH27_15805 [Methylomirabilota bacterium]|nr:hypothetical protein [Methylomirabilota bacterium]